MSFSSIAAERPPRVSFTNLRSGETVEMPLVPETLDEEVTVNWTKQVIVGMSHEQLQYSHTSNHSFPGLEFIFRAESPEDLDAITDGRKFLLSLTQAPADAQGVRDGAPPRILFFWPQLVSMTCVLGGIRITHELFNKEGASVRFKVRLNLEEIRDVRLTMDDLRDQGTQRSNRGSSED